MNLQTDVKAQAASPHLVKLDPATPALTITADGGIAIKAGTSFCGKTYDTDEIIPLPPLQPGSDYAVAALEDGTAEVVRLTVGSIPDAVIGGFHFAPGGIAIERKGGDDVPAINPTSLWDRNFRPACPDPRGMALIEGAHGHKFWCDIYLLGVDHVADGTSKHGVKIADGSDCPTDPATGKTFKRFEYQNAVDVMAHHGKQLLSFEEFAHAAYGVTEKSAISDDPVTTKLDAPRTSKFGIMQATGNMWVWGHDGDPDEPRASVLGGSWWFVGLAGSRYASVDSWPDASGGNLGARGRSDHLQLV